MGGPRPLVIPLRVREAVRPLPPTIKPSRSVRIYAVGERRSIYEEVAELLRTKE